MTKPSPTNYPDPRPHPGAGAPVEEIDITEEMIAAGVAAAAGYDSRFEPFESLPIQVYEAMERAKRHRGLHR